MRTICRHPGMTDVKGDWEWEPDPTAPSLDEIRSALMGYADDHPNNSYIRDLIDRLGE